MKQDLAANFAMAGTLPLTFLFIYRYFNGTYKTEDPFLLVFFLFVGLLGLYTGIKGMRQNKRNKQVWREIKSEIRWI